MKTSAAKARFSLGAGARLLGLAAIALGMAVCSASENVFMVPPPEIIQVEPSPGFTNDVARVRAVQGKAYGWDNGWKPLQAGQKLSPGANLYTEAESKVDLFLGINGPVARLTADCFLVVEQLEASVRSAPRVVHIRLNVKKGSVLGNFKKPNPESYFEVRTPAGVTMAVEDESGSGSSAKPKR